MKYILFLVKWRLFCSYLWFTLLNLSVKMPSKEEQRCDYLTNHKCFYRSNVKIRRVRGWHKARQPELSEAVTWRRCLQSLSESSQCVRQKFAGCELVQLVPTDARIREALLTNQFWKTGKQWEASKWNQSQCLFHRGGRDWKEGFRGMQIFGYSTISQYVRSRC